MSGLVEVQFEPAGRRVLVPPGTTLLAASRLAEAEIHSGCTRGDCGTDPVQIRSGADGLAPAADGERATLERMGLPDGFRLSCSAQVVAGTIVVDTEAF
ncbi:MAG: (2Fe-2S)-binding protein [Phycisphaerales bacterium]|nr:(2Fe-2S)-binding protein [Phycisphaerales bacterium]